MTAAASGPANEHSGLWEGPENRLACWVCLHRVWQSSAPEPRIIVLHGPAGVGKSHLLGLTRQRLTSGFSDEQWRQQTAAEFCGDYAAASEARQISAWRKRYQGLRVWIVEDLQGFSGRENAQQSFRMMLDEHLSRQGWLLVSARTPPGQIPGLEPKLRSRLHAGVLIGISPLAPENRPSFFEHALRVQAIRLPVETKTGMLRHLGSTPREILGQIMQQQALISLGHTGDPPSFTESQGNPREVTPHAVAKAVARQFGVPLTELRGSGRAQRVVLPRHCAMFLIRELTSASLQAIGDYLGGRDHATVLHALNNWEARLLEHPDLQSHLSQIRQALHVQ